jgi:uncharacterized MAPEG superfamily protein
MGNELTILALYGMLIIVVILIETTLALPQLGLPYMASPRDELREKHGLAGRAERTVRNCVIGMALFAPAILILNAQGALTATTLLAAQVFLIARVIYVIVYILGVPYLRTLAFVASLLATLYLYFLAL